MTPTTPLMPIKLFVDITPVRRDPRDRTGLARVAIELATALTRHPALDVACGSLGHPVAADDLSRLEDLPELSIVQPPPGFLARRYCDLLTSSRYARFGQPPTGDLQKACCTNRSRPSVPVGPPALSVSETPTYTWESG